MKNELVKSSPFRMKNVLVKSSPFRKKKMCWSSPAHFEWKWRESRYLHLERRWGECKTSIRMRKQHALPMNPCVRIIFKSKQCIIWAIIRSTTLLTSLLCGSWALPCPSHCFAGVRYFFVANSFKSLIQVCLPQCRVTMNCKFFTMASIEGMYQLLIVSYVLASGSDLVTPSRGSSESTVHRWRVKAADPTLATGPHSLTGADCLG